MAGRSRKGATAGQAVGTADGTPFGKGAVRDGAEAGIVQAATGAVAAIAAIAPLGQLAGAITAIPTTTAGRLVIEKRAIDHHTPAGKVNPTAGAVCSRRASNAGAVRGRAAGGTISPLRGIVGKGAVQDGVGLVAVEARPRARGARSARPGQTGSKARSVCPTGAAVAANGAVAGESAVRNQECAASVIDSPAKSSGSSAAVAAVAAMGQLAAAIAAIAAAAADAAGGGIGHQRAIQQREVAQVKNGPTKARTACSATLATSSVTGGTVGAAGACHAVWANSAITGQGAVGEQHRGVCVDV